jgi:hypothetical protein
MDLRIHIADYIKVERLNDDEGFRRVATFPELVRAEDGTYRGIIDPETGAEIECPYESYIIALIQWGYENLESNHKLIPGRRFTPPAEGPTGFFPRRDIVSACKPRYKGGNRPFDFPTLCIGPRGGYVEAFNVPGGKDPFMACYIHAIQVGTQIKHWDNPLTDIIPDDTEERLAALGFLLEDLPEIVEDSGWVLNERISNPRRGLRNWDRKVTFQEALSGNQVDLYRERLALDKCPGLGVGSWGLTGKYTYHFRTALDSSD